MKNNKYFFLLIFATCILFNSCAFIDFILDSPEAEKKKTPVTSQNSYTSSDDNKYFHFEKIDILKENLSFDQADNNKKLFVIYTNETKDNLKHERSAADTEPNMTIYKGVTYMGHGIYRDEVHFDIPDHPGELSKRGARTAAAYRDEDDDKFYKLYKDNQKQYDSNPEKFIKKADGKHCRIWFCDDNPEFVKEKILTQNEFKKLANNFDLVFEKETQIFGSNKISGYSNVITANEDTKIDILVYDLFGDANPNQNSGTLGFFYSADLLTNQKGNKCEAIHVDSFFLQYDIKGVENDKGQVVQTNMTTSTIVHEFQHLLNYCQKISNGGVSPWYNEMLSMCAEDIFQEMLQLTDDETAKSRFKLNFNTPWQGFYNWPESDGTEEGHEKVLHAYANAYAFGAYLMRNYGGVELIHNICTNNTKDEDSITDALHTTGYTSEDYNSVLQKFGSVYILNHGGITLNKSVTTNFYGVNYQLSPINLKNFYFETENNQSDYNKYFIQGNIQEGTLNGNKVFALFGPGIFKAGYTFNQTIQNTGFVVYYLGNIDSSKTYSVANIKKKTVNNDNLTMSIVVID